MYSMSSRLAPTNRTKNRYAETFVNESTAGADTSVKVKLLDLASLVPRPTFRFYIRRQNS